MKRISASGRTGRSMVHLKSSGWEQLGEKLFPSSAPQENAETGPDQAHIPGYQEILWDFLLNAADGSGRISRKDLKKYSKDKFDEDAINEER